MSAKGAKRSVKMWTTNFYKSFFKKFLLYINGRLSKINLFSTYVCSKVDSCFWEAVYIYTKFYLYTMKIYCGHRVALSKKPLILSIYTTEKKSFLASLTRFLYGFGLSSYIPKKRYVGKIPNAVRQIENSTLLLALLMLFHWCLPW